MNKTAPKNGFSGFISPLVLVVLILLFAGVGYWYFRYGNPGAGLMKKSSNVQQNSLSQENAFPDNTLPLSTKVITNARTKWGSLVIETEVHSKIEGEVVKIEENTSLVLDNGNKLIGTTYTLKRNTSESSFFVMAKADYVEGDLKEFSNWKKISSKDIKVGDEIRMIVFTPLIESSSPDTYVGTWVFKKVKS